MTVTDLHVEISGEGAPAVVLVHAPIADLRMWNRQVAMLEPDHLVIRYDVRGFGRSPDPDGDHWDHEDLLAVMAAAGVERAVLVGSSNGGRIVLDTAVTAPGRVLGIVLAASALPGTATCEELQADVAGEDEALESGDNARAKAINRPPSWSSSTARRTCPTSSAPSASTRCSSGSWARSPPADRGGRVRPCRSGACDVGTRRRRRAARGGRSPASTAA